MQFQRLERPCESAGTCSVNKGSLPAAVVYHKMKARVARTDHSEITRSVDRLNVVLKLLCRGHLGSAFD